ncbi:tRNA N6-adenosine(37)-N6-threonylcarbamoyltransferase complex dimerization subunit TsaB [Vespertiliibacter pulmonis]|uniref:tRNA threonylcarbamoyladenosine biosynthesis protein TsaB n=1 Tax=Vespertiliibacter pulmonis TaxID=1443036 RepID=A0A3N4W168_9PAST|nr:tRNA (adenosine(37)-N6)-threonylcarbamoyltransferase complex dimerization subunit type 1 TsaB [Vespertiliibacter pulmonis]QLB20119.1 tRNA N6-adenosine(37)-N6-threonylcarbamoyltransferase complex dimerization subunit TsaB [Vespertiliibacter pulmonis]RPE86089.1 tRNA threonylcarbamoyladenosine biosynthesis protein TsaB [Vespertiliibacter pulmonis]
MKTILVLDTATEACSVALLHQGIITSLDELSPRTHTQRILPMVDELLDKAGISIKQVELLGFGRGPGSFTGVRVGVGIAQGLAMGAELPVVPVSNLLAMAEAVYQKSGNADVVALIDARMSEVYFAQFSRSDLGWQEIVPEQVCSAEKAIEQIQLERNPIVVGTGWQAYSAFSEADLPLVVSDITLPSAKFMLPLVIKSYELGKTKSAMEIEPVYLRNEVTWQKLPHKR